MTKQGFPTEEARPDSYEGHEATAMSHNQSPAFMIMACTLAIVGVGAIIVVAWLLPNAQAVQMVSLDTAIVTVLTTILTLFRVQESHQLINSRLDEFKKSNAEAMMARGREMERTYQEGFHKARLEAAAVAAKEIQDASALAAAKILETATIVAEKKS